MVVGRIDHSREKGYPLMSRELRPFLERAETDDQGTAKKLTSAHRCAAEPTLVRGQLRTAGARVRRPHQRSVSVGDKVQFLPPRREAEVGSDKTRTVAVLSVPRGEAASLPNRFRSQR